MINEIIFQKRFHKLCTYTIGLELNDLAITIKDIALESGYAVSTVSRVINNHPEVSEKARNTIMEIVSKRGFVPNAIAQQLPKRKNQLVGIVVKGTENLFFSHLVEKMEQSLFSKGYFTVVIHLSEGENEMELAHAISVLTSIRGIFSWEGQQKTLASRLT